MNKNTTTTGEALAASQEATLVIEQFLNENYRFRRNVLNGKVEFAILPKETGATLSGASDEAELVYRPLTQAALNSIVIRAKREQVMEKGNPKTEITEYVQSEEVPEHNPVQDFLNSLPQWDGQNHIARIFGRAQEDRTRFASFVATTNNRHPLKDATGSRRYICILIPDGQMIDNTGDIDYGQLYAQVMYELMEQKAPYWFNNDEVARIQQLNQEFMEKKDLCEMFVACFRQPLEGEEVKTMNCGEIISLMQKDYPSLQNTVGNKVRLGKTISALGFKHKDHSHVAYYEVVPLKAA